LCLQDAGAVVNSKGCSFIVAVLVAAIGLGIGYYKFRAQQHKALHDARVAQWHGPLLAMLGHPAHIRFQKQFFSVSGYLCGEYALDASTPRRFVVSPDAVVLVGDKAYTQSADEQARRQRRQYQARFDALVKKGATAQKAFDAVAWGPHCG
jgi:hypothetical protein